MTVGALSVLGVGTRKYSDQRQQISHVEFARLTSHGDESLFRSGTLGESA